MARPTFNEIKIFADAMDDMDIIRTMTSTTIDHEKAFYIADIGNVIQKHQEWITKMPRVIPHFGNIFFIFTFLVIRLRTIHVKTLNLFQILAIKCNPDPTVIKVLAALNAGFDCASKVRILESFFNYLI